MKTILITGISGFAGNNLAAYLLHHTHWKILGSSRKKEFSVDHTNIKLVPADSRMWDEEKIDAVIHLAGIAHDLSGEFVSADYEKVNVEGTKSLVDEFIKSKASIFIFISSIKAVADHSDVVLDELAAPRPQTDYGKSKRKAEQYIISRQISDKSFYILRPAMMYGPTNKGNLNLLYRFVKSGWPFPLGAFQNLRSFLSVENFSFVIRSIIEGKLQPGTYHVADSGFLSTNELYALIADVSGIKNRNWKLPKKIIQWAATLTGQTNRLNKLTENMMVSNNKLIQQMGCDLPVSLNEGLRNVIKNWNV